VWRQPRLLLHKHHRTLRPPSVPYITPWTALGPSRHCNCFITLPRKFFFLNRWFLVDSIPPVSCVHSSLHFDLPNLQYLDHPSFYIRCNSIGLCHQPFRTFYLCRTVRIARWPHIQKTPNMSNLGIFHCLHQDPKNALWRYSRIAVHLIADISPCAASTDLDQGTALLASPYHNKGSAFPSNERKEFKLYGLLPPNVQTLDEQVHRAYEQYSSRPNDLAKNTFMTSMKEQNEVLFYKVSCWLTSNCVGIGCWNVCSSFKIIWKRCSASYIRQQRVMRFRTTLDYSGNLRVAFWILMIKIESSTTSLNGVIRRMLTTLWWLMEKRHVDLEVEKDDSG